MTPVDIAVILGGIALIALLAWYFFSPQKATHAQVEEGRQVVDITVKGGYSQVAAADPYAAGRTEQPVTGAKTGGAR